MNNISDSPVQKILRNSLRSLLVLFLSSVVFVSVITIPPLLGSLTMNSFPLSQVFSDNFGLLIPLLIVSMMISPLLGWTSYKLRRKRFLYLLLIGITGCWLAIVFVMFIWSDFTVDKNDIGSFMLLSVWALAAYSFFSLPILVPAILIIEKWTREKK